jgi:2-polyprenyl-3-methyl-5-hydroxy-6-metoxy-1,4-benzoquinol methylase
MNLIESCICCGSELASGRFLFQKKNAKYYRCSACGLIFQNPQPPLNSAKEIYDDFDYQNLYFNATGFYTQIAGAYLKQIHTELAKKNVVLEPAKCRLLDVGSSIGLFLSLAKKEGFDAKGFDISSLASKFAKENYDVDVTVGNFLETALPENGYDIITMWQVIEHLTDPGSFLKKIHSLLKPGGYFCVATPDTDTFFRKLYKKYWGIYVPDLHITLFNRQNMKTILERNNFLPVAVTSIHETNIISEQFEYTKFFIARITKNIILKTKIFRPLVPRKLIEKWEKQTYLDIPLPCLNYSVFAIGKKPQ